MLFWPLMSLFQLSPMLIPSKDPYHIDFEHNSYHIFSTLPSYRTLKICTCGKNISVLDPIDDNDHTVVAGVREQGSTQSLSVLWSFPGASEIDLFFPVRSSSVDATIYIVGLGH